MSALAQTPSIMLAPETANESANGKALEYACTAALQKLLQPRCDGVTLLESDAMRTASRRFGALLPSARLAYERSADAGARLLEQLEPRIKNPPRGRFTLSIQTDAQGEIGDVRDILLRHASGWEVGFSIKHNNDAAKHPRLSGNLDFARAWIGTPSDARYFAAIKPVFDDLEQLASIGAHWSSLGLTEAAKALTYYHPVLEAVGIELQRLALEKSDAPVNLFRYLIGRNDFYKVIARIRERVTEVQAFCFAGKLGTSAGGASSSPSASRLPVPTKLMSVAFKPNSDNTLLVAFDQSWTLSLRIHNASSRVERSLKLDVRLTATPPSLVKLSASWSI